MNNINNLLLSTLPVDELFNRFREIIREEIKAENQNALTEKLLSPDEVCKMFTPNITRPTLISWTDKGFIPMQRIGGRLFYKYSDVIQAGTTLKKYKNK